MKTVRRIRELYRKVLNVKPVLWAYAWRTLNLKTMLEKKCLGNELKVTVSRKGPKFKGGSDLAESVNLVQLDTSFEETQDEEIVKVSLLLTSKSCQGVSK